MNKSLSPLNVDQVYLLKKSFRMLDPSQTSQRFYSKLFQQYPFVKPLFPNDMTELGGKLMSVFELVIYSFEETSHNEYTLQQSLIVPMRELGRKHDTKGVLDEYYGIANTLILETLQEELKGDFTDQVKIAWQLALDHLTKAMLDKSIQPSQHLVTSSGNTLRDTFSYIKKLILKPNSIL